MPTLEDFKKLTQLFVTKQEFQELKETVSTKEDIHRVTSVLDMVVGELKALRQHAVFHTKIHDRTTSRLEEIEKTPTIASELRKSRS